MIVPMTFAKYLIVGLLILSKPKTKVFSFDFFSLVSVTMIFTESITKPKILILCVRTIWDFLKFMEKKQLVVQMDYFLYVFFTYWKSVFLSNKVINITTQRYIFKV